MLELTCVVLALSGLAASTPHGYGVKGGASSGAVAGASAGAFAGSAPGFPHPVPIGNGFSGSFSKSSSSSFASSSASSSSSSSSFSYSGSAGGGLPGIGTDGASNGGCTSGACQNVGAQGLGAHGLTGIGAGLQSYNSANAVSAANAGANSIANVGCSSGHCQTPDDTSESATHGSSHDIKAANTEVSNGVHAVSNKGCSSGNCHSGPNSNTNLGVQAHNNANAASTADAGSILGSGCQGSKCGIHSSKCTSGNCGEQSHPTADKKCTSGYCGTTDNGPSTINQDAANKYDKQSSSSPNGGYGCATGNCGSSLPSSPDNNNLSTDDDIYIGHKPSTQLQAPHSRPLCTSGKCGPTETNAGHRPSSYNVPIHGGYNIVPKPNCIGSHCDNHQSVNKVPSNNEPTSYFSPYSGSTNVNGPSTHGSPSGIGSLKCTGQSCSNSETLPALTSPSQEIPTSTICKTQGCGATGTNEKGTYDKSSIHGNSLSNSGHISNGQHLFTPTYNTAAVGSASSGCTSPNCAGPSPSASGLLPPSTFINAHPSAGVNPSRPVNINTQPVFGVTQPIPSSQDLPVYNGGFGGPAGVLMPNEYNKVTGKPGYTSPGLNQNTPASGPGTTSCNSPNCNGYSSDAAAVAGAHAHSQSNGVPKPNPSKNQPSYTGGFGGPTGLLNPTGAHSTSPGNTPTAIPSFTKPSGNTVSPGCTSYNCAEPSPIAGANTNSFGASNVTPEKHEIPYTGGFGGPVGVLKPHIVGSNIPATLPTQPGLLYNTPNQVGSSNCKTGNCGSPTNTFNKPTEESKPTDINTYNKGPHASTSSIQPNHQSIPGSYTPVGSISPSGCTTLNCGGHTTSAATAETNSQSVGFTKPAVTIPNLPHHNGGFPSTLKPGEGSVTSPTHNGPSVPGCKSSNCFGAPAVSAGAGAGAHAQSGVNQLDTSHLSEDELPPYKGGFGGPVGILKPNDFSVPAAGVLPNAHLNPSAATKPASCSSGVCAHTSSPYTHSTLSQATAGSTANAEEISYTGSFGGPPGVLKPYESDKAGAVNPNAKHTVGTHYSPSSIVPHSTGVGSPTISSQTATSGLGKDQIGSVDKNNEFANAGADAQGYAGSSGFGNGNIGANSGSIGLGHSGASGFGSTDTKAPWQFGSTGLSNGMAQAGAVAHSSAVAGASSGATSGDNGYHNVKGGSGCGGGCGGSHSGSSSFGYSSGLGLARPGYSDGLSGSFSASGASAKSLSSAGAFGGSVATAHAYAGAGVKGYGKR